MKAFPVFDVRARERTKSSEPSSAFTRPVSGLSFPPGALPLLGTRRRNHPPREILVGQSSKIGLAYLDLLPGFAITPIVKAVAALMRAAGGPFP